MIRVWSPSSGSTLMTSAPWSASSMVQNGPASIWVRSTMRTPSRAPRTSLMWTAGVPPAHDHDAGGTPAVRKTMNAIPASLVSPVTAALDQHPALALEDMLVVLIHAVVLEAHDASVGLVGIGLLQHLGIAIERVAVVDRRLQADLVQPQLHQRVLGRVLGGEADAHRDGDAAEAQPLAPRARLHQVLVEVALGGVHGDVGDPHLLERLDGLAAGVLQHLADGEVLEVVVLSGEGRDFHQFLPRPSRRSEMMRFWISDVPSKILVRRASRQWRSTACRVV